MNYKRGDVVIVPFPFVTIVRCEYLMTLPRELVARKLGHLPKTTMSEIDKILKRSLGLD
ncbi:MAG: hypothetical protein ACE5I1_18645 [bacterium]